MVYVFLANGFEEIEAFCVVDILKRAKIEIKTVGIGKKEITGTHGIKVICDILENDINLNNVQAIVLPGGMPGTINLENSTVVINTIKYCLNNNKFICAICAAPSILGHLNALNGKTATCFPGFEKELYNAVLSDEPVCTDGKIITAKSAWFAIDFALEIVKNIQSENMALNLKRSLKCM